MTKKEKAIAFLQQVVAMPAEDLNRLITSEAGGELTSFLMTYAVDRIRRNPTEDTAASLMMLGYLIRVSEDSLPAPRSVRS